MCVSLWDIREHSCDLGGDAAIYRANTALCIKWLVYQKAFILLWSCRNVPCPCLGFIMCVCLCGLKAPDGSMKNGLQFCNKWDFSLCRMPEDFAPDKGHDRGEQSGSSGCWDTFGSGCCRDGGHNEQNRAQRSSHCTTSPDSRRPVWLEKKMLLIIISVFMAPII